MRWPPIFRAHRLQIGLAVAAGLILALTGLLDGTGNPRRAAAMPTVWALLTVLGVVWGAEVVGWRLPRLILAAVTAGLIGWLIVLRFDDIAPLFLIALVIWVRLTGTQREALAATVLGAAAFLPTLLYEPPTWLTWTIAVVAVSVMTGALLEQRRLVAELRAAQDDLAREAAAAERRRIAREVHDLIAHSLAVTMLHLTGARHVLSRDPERAADALAEAERLGRQSLADVRRTVGLLGPNGQREPAGSVSMAALPGVGQLATLVSEYRSAGLPVTLETDGELTTVSDAAGLAVYRIMQEALANVVKHAPGAQVAVTLNVGDEINLRVRSSGGATSSPRPEAERGGLGIAGMQERARLLGGALTAGPNGDGWLVACALPRDDEPTDVADVAATDGGRQS